MRNFLAAVTVLITTTANAANISFYDGANKHKGFYWFEVQEKAKNLNQEVIPRD